MTLQLLDEVPPAQRLALAYAPASARDPLLAVLALDARLAVIVRRRHEIVLAQMRIAWWRDMLAGPRMLWPRGDPVLGMLREWRDPAPVAALADGWELLLDEILGPAAIDGFAQGRERALAAAAHELGLAVDDDVALAARYWALADLAANLSDPAEREEVVALSRTLPPPPRLPRALRPLAVLAGLGARSLRQGGAPLLSGSTGALCALRLGLFGR